MTRGQRLVTWLIAAAVTVAVIAGIALYTISRTEFGHERVRRIALGWLAKRVDGTVRIGSIGGVSLLHGVVVRDLSIIDKLGRPFLHADSAVLAYNWRTLAGGDVVIDKSALFHPELYFEQLPGDTLWNFQRVFPDRNQPGKTLPSKRLILLRDIRIVNGFAVVRRPLENEETKKRKNEETKPSFVVERVPGGFAQVMRFDSVNGQLSRVIWESPTQPGRLIDIRSLAGRGYIFREPLHLADMRGTVTLRDTIVGFDIPQARFANSSASIIGSLVMKEGQNIFDIRVHSPQFAFADLQWLYERLPQEGGGSGDLRILSQRPKGYLWLATNTRISSQGSHVAGNFGVATGGDSLYFTNVNLRASPLNLDLVRQMVPRKLPLDGLISGTVQLKGGLNALDTRGDVRFSSAGSTSGVKWRGRVDVENGFGAENLKADVDRLDLALINKFRPDLDLRGQVSGHVEASGRLNSTIRFTADLQHYLAGYTSSFTGGGTYTGGASPILDLQLNALPVSLPQLAASYPALARLRGEVRGPIRLYGPLSDLNYQADLQTLGGRAVVEGRLSRALESRRYTGAATLYSFHLDRIINDLPEMAADGTLKFDVAGNSAATSTGTIEASLAGGTIRGVEFGDAHALMTLDHGLLKIDTLSGQTFFGVVGAHGAIGIANGRTGTIAFDLRTDSIAPLTRNANKPLSTAGLLRASGTMAGAIQSFDLKANVDVVNLLYGSVTSDHVRADITGMRMGGDSGRIVVSGRADSVVAYGVKADSAGFALTWENGRGDMRIAAGSEAHSYIAESGFATVAHGMMFTLRDLRLGNVDHQWTLARPTTVSRDDHGLSVDSIEVRHQDGGSVTAAGIIAWHDSTHTPEAAQHSDFRLELRRVPFTEFAQITVGNDQLQGELDGHVRVTGNAVAPVLEAEANITDLRFGNASLERMGGSFTYANRLVNARVDAEQKGRRVLFADGSIPVNLAFMPVAQRALNEPLRFTIEADSLPPAFVTTWIGGFTDVRGQINGTMTGSGTTLKPQLGGSITLKDGNAHWDVTNVGYRDVNAAITLESDRTARVDATLKANGGSGHVTGSIDVKKLTDPAFDLLFNAQNFLASKRTDVEMTGSGNVTLKGRYRQPRISGSIAVDQGTMFVDELYRRLQIIELDNPLLYDVVDTSLVSLRTILPRSRNPFVKNMIVENLRVNVGRESWLRSRDLNVEVAGDLTVAFTSPDTLFEGERGEQDLLLSGTLRAVRGTYRFAGPGISRQFTIREGTIDFPGTPGVDPNLAFNAVYRARSQRREPIDIIAVVSGTLRTPRIHLTSNEEPPIGESDLASYLFFGAPTYELSASQAAVVSQATSRLGSDVLTVNPFGRALASSGFGYLASGLQNLAQSYGLLDYVSLSATETVPGLSTQRGIGLLFAGTQLEVGRYLFGEDLYVVYSQRLTMGSGWRPSVRLEYRINPNVTGEFFVEDRFARNPDFGIQNTTSLKKVYGVFLYKEWGY